MIFYEDEPWLKAHICPSALRQTAPNAETGERLAMPGGYDLLKSSAERRMAEIDAMSPEWRRYVHEHGLIKARRAMKEYGKRSVKRATILGGIRLDLLDL